MVKILYHRSKSTVLQALQFQAQWQWEEQKKNTQAKNNKHPHSSVLSGRQLCPKFSGIPCSFCGAHIAPDRGKAEASTKQVQATCKPSTQEPPKTATEHWCCYSNSKPVSYKALVIFWREVVIRSDIFNKKQHPSQIIQTILCNVKSVRKQTSGLAACRFMS